MDIRHHRSLSIGHGAQCGCVPTKYAIFLDPTFFLNGVALLLLVPLLVLQSHSSVLLYHSALVPLQSHFSVYYIIVPYR